MLTCEMDCVGDLTELLECPVTRRALRWSSDRERLVAEGGPTYSYSDGIAHMLPGFRDGAATKGAGAEIREFYETEGWAEDEQGLFGDTRAFVDTRDVSFQFTRKCMARLRKHFEAGGRYLLDAGSGAVPHKEVRAYGDAYEYRVCMDLTVSALRAARSRLGESGLYVQGDLINLPFKTGSFDAVICNHVVYQLPVEDQAMAFRELWRVLKPGGVSVVVYLWSYVPLARRFERLARLLMGNGPSNKIQETTAHTQLGQSHHPQRRTWFESQDWPFRYRYDTFRVVDNWFLRNYVTDDWRGRTFLNALFALQQLAPSFCGRYGAFPAIIIHKD